MVHIFAGEFQYRDADTTILVFLCVNYGRRIFFAGKHCLASNNNLLVALQAGEVKEVIPAFDVVLKDIFAFLDDKVAEMDVRVETDLSVLCDLEKRIALRFIVCSD